MKKKEFSKIIIAVTFIIFVLVLIAGCVLAWEGSSVIFYYRKAQVENAVKIQLYSLEGMYKLREKYPSQNHSVEMAISSQESRIENLVNSYSSESTTNVNIQG